MNLLHFAALSSPRIRPRLAGLVPLLLGSVLAWAASAPAVEYRVVALSGVAPPGAAPGVTFSSFGAPAINEAGQTAFFAALAGPGLVVNANDESLWSEGSGALLEVARFGTPAPGPGTAATFLRFSGSPAINGLGQIAFGAAAMETGVGGVAFSGIWSEAGGGLGRVARSGDPAPDTAAGVEFAGFTQGPVFNDAGQTAFQARVTGPGVVLNGNDRGLWSEGGGPLGLVARQGFAAPETGGADFGTFAGLELNQAGQMAFAATLSGAGVTGSNDTGVWSEGGGPLALVARAGDPAPDTPAGVDLSYVFYAPSLDDLGRIAFKGGLTGAGVTGANNAGIFSETPGGIDLVARENAPVPGAPAGVTYFDFDPPVRNAAGQLAFKGKLAGAGVTADNDEAVLGPNGAGVTLFFRGGEPAPGLPAGVFLSSSFGFSAPLIDRNGGVLVEAGLVGPGVGPATSRALYYAFDSYSRIPVVRTGDPIEVAPGDVRTLLGFSFYKPTAAPGPRSLSGRPEVAILARFTDASQAVIVARIPRPQCACSGSVPLIPPVACYERPGPLVGDYAIIYPGHFVQVVDLGPVNYCRHNSSFQWIDQPGVKLCDDFLACLCGTPSLGAEVCNNGVDDDCDGSVDADDDDCDSD